MRIIAPATPFPRRCAAREDRKRRPSQVAYPPCEAAEGNHAKHGGGARRTPQRRGAVAAISANSARICSLRSRLSSSVSRSASRMRSHKPANLLHPEGSRLDVARVGDNPVVELAMEGPVSLVSRPPADRIGEPGDRAGIGARQAGDDRSISAPTPSDSGARRTSASRTDPSARLAAAAMASSAGFAPRRPEADHGPNNLVFRQRSSRKRRQRERIVGRTWPGRCDTMRISDRCGGSSTIFSNALALLRFRSSAASTMATRQPPKAAESWKTCSPCRTASTEISLASLFDAPCHSRRMREKSGWASPASSRAA